MSISYIITNNEELTTLEELGTLKNEIEKQRLLKKHGKQEQDYLLEKQFKPITKAIKGVKSDPEKRLEEAQKEVEEMKEQEITKELKKDGTTRLSVSPSIYPLITKLINSKHKQIHLKRNEQLYMEPNYYYLNGNLVTFLNEDIIFAHQEQGFNISPSTGLNFFLNPENKNKPRNYSDEEKYIILKFLKYMNYNNDKVDKSTEQYRIIKKWEEENFLEKYENDPKNELEYPKEYQSPDDEDDDEVDPRERTKQNWDYLNFIKNNINVILNKIKENSESVSDFEIENIINTCNEALKLMNEDKSYETDDFNKEIIHDILNKIKNFQKGKGLEGSKTINEFIFLPSDPHELCNRLKLLYQEKIGGNNNPQIDQEIMAISDKFLEYEIITTEQHENMISNLL